MNGVPPWAGLGRRRRVAALPAGIESWRRKGVSEARVSQAQREGMMGYERMKDPSSGRMYDMPLEAYDGAAGGYRNPVRPAELLVKAAPGE